jgi:prophage tail gpP-like protein
VMSTIQSAFAKWSGLIILSPAEGRILLAEVSYARNNSARLCAGF